MWVLFEVGTEFSWEILQTLHIYLVGLLARIFTFTVECCSQVPKYISSRYTYYIHRLPQNINDRFLSIGLLMFRTESRQLKIGGSMPTFGPQLTTPALPPLVMSKYVKNWTRKDLVFLRKPGHTLCTPIGKFIQTFQNRSVPVLYVFNFLSEYRLCCWAL